MFSAVHSQTPAHPLVPVAVCGAYTDLKKVERTGAETPLQV